MTSPLNTLRRIVRAEKSPAEERCDMCAERVAPDHQHLVDLQSRQLMCACRPCWLLFADDNAHQRYRAVPDRVLAVDPPALDDQQIPVGLVFLFRNSARDRIVALYPGPAGATESELDIAADDPAFAQLRPDVEALLVRQGRDAYLAPIDACYELTGRLRTVWRGFDGGQEARDAVDEFFTRLAGKVGRGK
ncbi:hypothetical protein JIG36_00120 [Actinoplanes sp. LDG1-06]|uniref:Uncharacterized protein n=1 Tax=Paractinoplanes ovalisporus TaxID=2810368 RepID=A0ABS2A287_9ACTN|nr:DUF5947 family protein [Actinoplanes ovalisporus]MBM2613959.1 hypothetical protein [Actinoplanes ovalisporus]